MAGVGRRTLYRKSVTDDYLNSTPEPGDNEEIALAQAPRGSNIIEIMLASGEPALALLPTRFRKLIWVKRGDYLITSTSAGDFETSAGEAGKVRHRVEHILNKDQVKHLKKQGLWPADDAFGGSLSSAGVGPGNPREGWGNATDTAAGGSGGGTGGGRGGGTALGGDTDGDEPKKAAATGAEDAVGDGADGGVAGKGSGEEGAGAEPEEEQEEEEEEEEDDMSDLFVNNNRAAMMQLRTDHEDDEEDSDSDSDE